MLHLRSMLPLALAALCAPAWASRDSEVDELRIAVGLLRSQAAELMLLQAQAHDGQLPPRSVRAHAHKLAEQIAQAREQLEKTPPVPSLLSVKASALNTAERMAALAEAMNRGMVPADGAAEGLLQRLLPAEETLKAAQAR